MKILFVIDSLGFGGAERQLVELINGLSRKNEYSIHLICLMKVKKGYARELQNKRIQIEYAHRNHPWELLKTIIFIHSYIIKHNITFVHTFMNMGSLLGVVAAKLSFRPVIASAIRDAKDSSNKEKWIKRIIALFSDFYVSNSYAGFYNRFNRIYPKFKVIYNGLNFSRFQTTKRNKEKLFLEFKNNKEFLVCMVASLSMNKDHMTLLEAIPKVIKDFPETTFLFVGDGPNRIKIEKVIKSMALSDFVCLTGYRDDVDCLYSIMDICILLTKSSVHLEGISNALTEAMANQVPVIASKGGGTDELLTHNVTGILIPPNDHSILSKEIINLLQDSYKRKTIAAQGKEFVRSRFGIELYVREYEKLYKKLKVKMVIDGCQDIVYPKVPRHRLPYL